VTPQRPVCEHDLRGVNGAGKTGRRRTLIMGKKKGGKSGKGKGGAKKVRLAHYNLASSGARSVPCRTV
jgi:hypothetical protein